MQVGQLRLPIINAQGKIDVCHFGVTMCKSMAVISTLKSPLTLGQGSFCLLHRDSGSAALTY